MNPDQMDFDENDVFQPTKPKKRSTAQVLKNVVVPGNSRSSLRSSLSSVHDQLTDYDTPATSVDVTPAESLVKEESAGRKLSQNVGSHGVIGSYTSAKGKRKRMAENGFLEADARLAQALQEEEYKQQPTHPDRKRTKESCIEDSEDEPFSSSAPNIGLTPTGSTTRKRRPAPKPHLRSERFSDESNGVAADNNMALELPRTKKSRTSLSSSLPSRAARDIAKTSLKDIESQLIPDSEDDDLSSDLSDVSMFSSESDSDENEGFERSDEEDDEIMEGSSNMANAVVENHTPPGAATLTTDRRRASAARNGNFRRSRLATVREDRVSWDTLCTYVL